MSVSGECAPRFDAVREAFEQAHADAARGAALAVRVGGDPVVDLWTGEMRPGQRWHADTEACAFSVAKAVTATAIAILVDRGELELDRPVADWWPEFAAAGKQHITVRTVLTHQAGTNWFADYARVVSCDDAASFVDLDPIWAAIASAPPVWPPNTRVGYTSMTVGWIASALVQRTTGLSLGAFVAEQIATPLGLETLHLGVPVGQLSRVADLVPEAAWEGEQLLANINPQTPAGKNLFLAKRTLAAAMRELWNDDTYRGAEQGAINLVTTARDLAVLFDVWAGRGTAGSVELFGSDTAADFMRVQAETPQDAAIHSPQRLGLLLWRPHAGYSFGPNDETVAHIGLGGATGIGDPVAGVSIAYVPGELRVQSIFGTDLRLAPAIDAVYAART